MGRGNGGYTEKQPYYRDSMNNKVTDQGAIFVAERYIDQGFEVVFRQDQTPGKHYDLTIKDSSDTVFVKNIEVKKMTSENPGQIAKNIKRAFEQLDNTPNGTVALYFENHTKTESIIDVIKAGYKEAKRKNNVHGNVEVWFKDKTCMVFTTEE